MLNKTFEKLQDWYWQTWPYDWRPGQAWYRFKCWAWHRYSTVKCRYLDHTWCDRRGLLPNTMFEILSQFIEQECSPGHVEWYGDYPHMVTVDGKEKNARDEMQDLYDWWRWTWNEAYGEIADDLWEQAAKYAPRTNWVPTEGDDDYLTYDPQFDTEEDELQYNRYLKELNQLEINMEDDLQEHLHRLINIRQYLWT